MSPLNNFEKFGVEIMNNLYKTAYMAECSDYSKDNVKAAMESLMAECDGLDWVQPGMRIGIKLNLCSAKKPESAAVTHYALASELTRMLVERGADVVLGDSPGGPFNHAYLQHIYDVTGMDACCREGGELNFNFETVTVKNPDGVSVKEYTCCKWITECDAVISFCKLKSHGMMGMTGAVKNIYGVIPGTIKSEYHYLHTDPMNFANLLIDLNESVKPQLYICDAVEIMEGNGPTAGTPRHLGLVLAGSSPYDIDRACASLLGLNESEIPYLQAAVTRGLLPESIEGLNEKIISGYKIADFQRSGATASWFALSPDDKGMKRIAKRAMYVLFRSKPVPDSDCTGCGHCARSCPAKAIEIKKGRAEINRRKCVRCFCCQEFCPSGAMKVQRSLVAKLVVRN